MKAGVLRYVCSKLVYGFCLTHCVSASSLLRESILSDGHIPVCKYLKRHTLCQTYYGMCGAALAHFTAVIACFDLPPPLTACELPLPKSQL